MALLFACKPTTPDGIIPPGEMEDLLVDYHLAYGIAMQQNAHGAERDFNQTLFAEEVFRKHGVTRADFDSSLVYYYSRSDRFDKIYHHVAERLDKQALALGASESDIGKYSTLNASGDTANIWAAKPAFVLAPMPPYNRMEFELQADTSYREGDKLLLQFMADYVYQNGSRGGVVVVAATYDNDSTITRSMTFGNNGLTQLYIMGLDNHTLKRLRGFFYLGGALENTTVQRMLFVNNIQLIRFHKQHEAEPKEPEPLPAEDSIAPAADRRGEAVDTASSRDSVRTSRKLLQLNPRTGAN